VQGRREQGNREQSATAFHRGGPPDPMEPRRDPSAAGRII
jgi:hypothetical protein